MFQENAAKIESTTRFCIREDSVVENRSRNIRREFSKPIAVGLSQLNNF